MGSAVQHKQRGQGKMGGKGSLIIIGGAEEKEGQRRILSEIAKRVDGHQLVIVTTASEIALEVWKIYEKLFRELGVTRIRHLAVEKREEAIKDDKLGIFEDANAVFFTGGDQLKITTKLGGTLIAERIKEIFEQGGLIAGTSAGASVMSETMLVSGLGGESHKVGGALLMAPGLGLIKDMIIDQHFAQRGRIGRLLGAVAQNPGVLGIGIDEDTAIIVEGEQFHVIGSGAVYIADGQGVSYTNMSEDQVDRTMCLFDVRLHVLGEGCTFDLNEHRPIPPKVAASSRRADVLKETATLGENI